MLLIGSLALKHHIPHFSRKLLDVDYIATRNEIEEQIQVYKNNKLLKAAFPVSATCVVAKLHKGEHDYPLIQEYNVAYENSSNKYILDYCKELTIAPLNVLLMLKLSHRYKKNSPHFLKTMQDIQYLRDLGVTLDNELKDILKIREKETYTYSHPSLMQGKDSFFVKDESFYVYDHDSIHEAVATLDKPAYKYFQPENSEVMTSKKMWTECSEDVKLRAGLEESYVLALERSLIPAPGVKTPKEAFDKALEKVCTSITSGWFREFCWEHYDEIQSLYDESFVKKFEDAKSKGLIKPFTKI